MSDDRWDVELPDEELRELLQTQFEAPPFAQEAVRDRIRASMDEVDARGAFVRPVRPDQAHGRASGAPLIASLSAAAAAVLIFVGGAEYGRRTAGATVAETPGAGAPPSTQWTPRTDMAASASLPISIQEAGSRYISRLAQLTARRASLSEGDRAIAEDVAWSSLRGAATELARLSENSEALAEVILLLERERAGPIRSGGISF